MATKKKTNKIAYELKKLENYIKQLHFYLDSIDLDKLVDRMDIRYSTQGNPIVKVVASKEAQVKSYRDNLEKLPLYYEQLNRLRNIADSTTDDDTVDKARGDKEVPGIFRHKMLGDGNNKRKENSEENEEDEPEQDEFEWEDLDE